MLICPNGHGEWPTKYRYCPECQAVLVALPAETGDSLRIRSPEAHASVQVVVPGGPAAAAAPTLVKCPKCGHRNSEVDVFDCQGPCGRVNLCRRHFDEEYDLCRDCASESRGSAQQEAARQARLEAEAKTKAEALTRSEAALAEMTGAHKTTQRELAQTREKLAATQIAAERAAVEWQAKVAALEKSLAEWCGRGEKAEGQLAEIARKERAVEAARQAAIKRQQEEASSTRRRAEEAAKQQPIWQRIGIELITIPAGEFLYGENKQKVNLPAYRIAVTPVTNAQYKAFVDATGYRTPSHWSGGQIPEGKENHPVVNVDWNDAEDFCAWAGVRLPTEQEWEKAARGTDGRKYPWGAWQPGRCNSSEAKIGATTPVDRFPSGTSPYGVLDAAGNVWEWCADWYDASQQARVLRGGAFVDESLRVRCAFRGWSYPVDRFVRFGFRVASPGL